MNVLKQLSEANKVRQLEWDPEGKTATYLYRATELTGEAGEAANKLKKLEREKLGIRGSRATKEQAMEELADTVICASLAANVLEGDLWAAVVMKFNKTSEEVGLDTRLSL